MMANDTMVLGEATGDYIALRVLEGVDPPDWSEPALKVEVTGNSTGVRFRSFETLIAVDDLRNFLEHLREAEVDNTVGGYLQSADGKLTVKLRGQGTGTFDLDCEVADAPEVRQAKPRSLALYPGDVPRLIEEIESALLGDNSN